jgi:hypothetical protein
MNEMRKFGPKSKDHPSCDVKCPVCDVPFKEGDFTTLVTVGARGEDREKMIEGRPYNAVAQEIHWDCRIIEP